MRQDDAKRLQCYDGVRLVDGRRGVIVAGPQKMVRRLSTGETSFQAFEVHREDGKKVLVRNAEIEGKLNWTQEEAEEFVSG